MHNPTQVDLINLVLVVKMQWASDNLNKFKLIGLDSYS